MFSDCGPSDLNWKVNLHYPLESIWTQPALSPLAAACLHAWGGVLSELGSNMGSKLLEGVNLDQSCLKPQV